MKVLTVQQYWAWAIIHGPKRVENRTWSTRHRGPLAIHAGKVIDPASLSTLAAIGVHVPEEVPSGAVIGTVDLVDVVRFNPYELRLPGAESPYGLPDDPLASGPYCWILRNPRPLPTPIPMRGQPGLFSADLRL